MNVKLLAEQQILKRKMQAEKQAEQNIDEALKNDEIRALFVKARKLVIAIAKIETSGQKALSERQEYDNIRSQISKILKQANINKDNLKPIYSCAVCKDSGYVTSRECECLHREISKILISNSGIDVASLARFGDDFSMFENAKEIKCLYDKMKQFVAQIDSATKDTILIYGNTGVGKTHLVECMVSMAIDKGVLTKYTTAFNFNQEMLRYHCAPIAEKSAILEPFVSSKLLVIDDLGSENIINNVTKEYLYLVINERMHNRRKTIITTNLDLAQIQDVYGERIFSRLMHKKLSLKIKMNGKDLRVGDI